MKVHKFKQAVKSFWDDVIKERLENMEINRKSISLHKKLQGKLDVVPKVEIDSLRKLSLVYSPGVAAPCLKIKENKNDAYLYTSKANTMAIITNGTAVLGLGDIGPEAALPVMEGKSVLFKQFAGVNCVPLCIDAKSPEDVIKFCKMVAPTFAAINLEDIKAPECITIERTLEKELDIPVFHDDQHGTAIVVAAALLNACKLANKNIKDIRVFVAGTGSAGSSIIKNIYNLGVRKISAMNRQGILSTNNPNFEKYDFLSLELLEKYINKTIPYKEKMEDAIEGFDVFIGISAPGILTKDMVKKMNTNPIIFALANPTPEIMPEDAFEAGAFIVGTGRSDYPNQINNVLAFPGIFKGAIEAKATHITDNMKIAAIEALSSIIPNSHLEKDYIIPEPFNDQVVDKISIAVKNCAIKEGVVRK